jgi:hypothetical protein
MWLILASVALADPSHAAVESASWEEVTRRTHADAGEVVVYRATVDGVDCFRGTAKVSVEAKKMLDVVADVEGAVRWSSAGVTEAKMLSKSGNKVEYFQYLDVPGWTMASDRFWFLSATLETGPDTWALRWQRLENGGAHKAVYDQIKADHSSAVEPPVNVGAWVFAPEGDATRLTYSVCTHPGGSIPVAVQNAATKKTLPDTLGDVVREAKRR